MKLVELSAKQPISIIVAILFIFLSGLVAVRLVAVEMTPEVEDTIVAVTTFWENASPQEIESEVVDPQEEKLQSLSNLRSITSVSSQGQGLIRLEFNSGIDKNIALRDVSDKLREVPTYPFGVDEPVIEATDPESQDYIAWYILSTDADDFDVRHLQTFAEDELKPILERVPGVSEVNALGGVEREVQIEVDVEKLSQYGVTISQLTEKLRESNSNASAGALSLGKLDIRLRSIGRFDSPERVKALVLRNDPLSGVVKVGDVATVKESFKEPMTFVRASGRRSIAFNFQREPGSNVLDIMKLIQAQVDEFNALGGVLENEANRLGINKKLVMKLSYDATRYVKQSLIQVENNIYIGGVLAVAVLLLFLRSIRSLGIIAISIPVSMVGAVVLMVSLGRTVNVISLAGIAFAVGMVVDNSIVVLENIYRHLEMGKKKFEAAVEGTSEVAGAVMASSLTTLIVFIPILLITDQVGQLFRDISLAIMTAVAFSYLVAVTVIPAAGARLLNQKKYVDKEIDLTKKGLYEKFLNGLLKSTILRLMVVAVMAVGSVWGAWALMPPMDYLPKGNRNITFGLMLTPPGLNIDQLEEMGGRVESQIKPYWEDQPDRPPIKEAYTGREVYPTSLSEYFLVSTGGIMFHGGISSDDYHAVDNVALLQHATRQDVLPGVFSFAFQFPLFRLGGSTGSAVKINLVGRDLDQVSESAGALFGTLFQSYGPGAVRPDPSNFNLKVQEVQIEIDEEAVAKANLSRRDVVLAMQAAGDGIFLGEYEFEGDLIDLKLWSTDSQKENAITNIEEVPISTPDGRIIRLGQLGKVVWTEAAEKIKRVGRRRAVTLEFTAPPGVPLEQVVGDLEGIIGGLRAGGAISHGVNTEIEGSAGKLADIKNALLGDGTLLGLMSSSMFTSFVAVYLLMCILFQSWFKPLVIMFTVPLATFGGFLGLYVVHVWSLSDPYMPIQNLDVLTLLGFIILSGVVVNNAILIVAQSDIFIKQGTMSLIEAIAKASQSRVRPIFMSLLTSVGGMLPLILNPGAGAELYRGLGAVVVGGMLFSTLFTLLLIPVLMSFIEQVKQSGKVILKGTAITMLLFVVGCKSSELNLEKELQQQDLPSIYNKELKETASHVQWWNSFEDPLINELIETAFEGEVSLKAFEKRVEQVLALTNLTDLNDYPTFAANSSVKREKIPSFQIPKRTSLTFGLSANYNLDWLGRLKDEQRISESQLSTAGIRLSEHKQELVRRILTHYSKFRYFQNSKTLVETEIAILKSNSKQLEGLHKAGRIDMSFVKENKIRLLQSQDELIRLTSSMNLERLVLERWVGERSDGLKQTLNREKAFSLGKAIRVGSPNELLMKRPDILIAANLVIEKAAALNLSKKEIYPQLSFGGEFLFYGQKLNNWMTSKNSGYSFGPQLSWRLFEFGRLKREREAAMASYDTAVLEWRQKVREAVLEVETGLESLDQNEKSMKLQAEIHSEYQDLLLKLENLFKHQRVSEIEKNDAKMNFTMSQKSLLNVKLEKVLSQIELYKALGLEKEVSEPVEEEANSNVLEIKLEKEASSI